MAKAASARTARTAARKTTARSVAHAPAARPRKKPGPVSVGPLIRPTGKTKFILYDLLGQPRAYYLVEPVDLPRPPADTRKKTVAHSAIVVDRSGSMAGAMPETRNTLVKLLTLDEYAQSDLLVTLISYAGEGDVTCHFDRAPIRDVMKRGSPYLVEIAQLRAGGRTCISQGLKLAIEKAKARELTAITLHSDGYADDPSPPAEVAALMKLTAGLRGKEAFVNAIAYTDAADFRLLSRVANAGGGSCIKAGNIGQVYNALYGSTKVLAGPVAPPVEMPLPKGYDYQVFVSRSAGRINAAADALSIRGLRPDDDGVVYGYKKLTKAEYDRLGVPEAQTSEAAFAFARGNLAEGNLNTAKYALASTFDATLMGIHGRALTNTQIAAFAADLDTLILFNPGQLAEHTVLKQVPVNRRIPLLKLIKLLDDNRDKFVVNRKAIQDVYVRRGLRRVEGTRDETGRLTPAWLRTEFVNDDVYLPVSAFETSRNTPTLNMLLTRMVRLVPAAGGRPVTHAAGVKLDNLRVFNNYTVVGDGDLNIPYLRVRIGDKKLYEALHREGVLEADGTPAGAFDPSQEYTLWLDHLPVVPPFEGSVDLTGVFDEISRLKVLSGIVSAYLEHDTGGFTPEQAAELKRHYLSRNLYVNLPTTTPYADLKQALAEGSVDTRISYKVDVGDRTILNLSKLPSANAFLERMYEVVGPDGRPLDHPTFAALLDGATTARHKKLSAKTKVTKADEFMKGLFDDFLGVKPNGQAVKVLESVGADKLAAVVRTRARRAGGVNPPSLDRKQFVEALTDARKKLDARGDEVFRDRLSPLVFYVGATGLLPDEVPAKALTADQLHAKYPDLSLSKDEKDGTFFELGDTILSVYAKPEYFSR